MNLINQYRGLRREVYILFFGRMVTNLGSMIWPVMTMILSQKLSLSASVISYYFVAGSLIMLPANLIGGKLADRFNKKWVIVFCDAVSVALYIICGFIPMSIATVVLFVVAGAFQSMEYPSYDALFADLSATKDRERAYSLDYLGANLGLVLSPTIAGLLFKDYLWLSFIISGVSVALSTLLIAVLIRDITPVEDKSEEASYQKSESGEGIFKILRKNPLILLCIVGGALYGAAYSQYSYIMPLDMGTVHGEEGAIIYGTVSSLNCITVVLFTPVITRIFKRMRETGKMITGRLLIMAGYVLFALILGFIPGYYIAMLIFTWGEIFTTISEGPYISRRTPASHRGRLNGFMSVLSTAVMFVIDIAIGNLYDYASPTAAWALIITITALSIVIAVILKALDKKAYPKLYK